MRITDVLRGKGTQVVTVPPDTKVRRLLEILAEHGIGAVVVSQDGVSVGGIVSERDIVRAFAKRGAVTEVRSSPWRLGPGWAGREWAALTEEWLRGWIAAACAQQPDLAAFAADYLHRRISASAAGELRVVVGHLDVLALPGPPFQGGTT